MVAAVGHFAPHIESKTAKYVLLLEQERRELQPRLRTAARSRLTSIRRPYRMNERSSSRVTIGMSNKWIGSGCTIRAPPDAKKSAIWP